MKELNEIIFKGLGEASSLFMSQPIKGTKIVMPTEELEKLGKKMAQEIKQLKF